MIGDLTLDGVIDAVKAFIDPISGECFVAQDNGVPMPKGEFCILTPLRFTRLSTTTMVKQDTGDPETSAIGYTEVRQADIQLDIYGAGAGDRAIAVETLFASHYAWSALQAINPRIAPLYASSAVQMPMIDAEHQWQERYMVTLSLQADITISLPQDYFDSAKFTTERVTS